MANGSWDRAVPCRIEARHFPAHQARGVVLSHSDPDGSPYLQRKEELVRELPLALSEAPVHDLAAARGGLPDLGAIDMPPRAGGCQRTGRPLNRLSQAADIY